MCSKRQRRAWWILRVLVFLAGSSLVGYIPYKYATQPDALVGIYGFLFPLSSLVALAGILLAVRPEIGFRLPFWLRTGLATIAMGWIATGVLCIPTLTNTVIAAPLRGLFATFHMTAQHVFLSFAVVFGFLAPQLVYSWFSLATPDVGRRLESKEIPERS